MQLLQNFSQNLGLKFINLSSTFEDIESSAYRNYA